MLAVSMACWYRDYISHYYDDAIGEQQRQAATEAARMERLGNLASR